MISNTLEIYQSTVTVQATNGETFRLWLYQKMAPIAQWSSINELEQAGCLLQDNMKEAATYSKEHCCMTEVYERQHWHSKVVLAKKYF